MLGTGTSQGTPVIGCRCEVCRSEDERDHRLRTSALLRFENQNIAIDCGPDFRQQMLRAGVGALDAILITHEHNDHVAGIDDVRPFNFFQRRDMPVYATARVCTELRRRFAYAFGPDPYPGAPRILLKEIDSAEPFCIGNISIIPIEVMHGNLPVLGFRIGNFTYLTDVKTISPDELYKVSGTEVLVINALQQKPHSSHLHLEAALELIECIAPRKAYLTHIAHTLGRYRDVSPTLPPGVELGWDGLEITME